MAENTEKKNCTQDWPAYNIAQTTEKAQFQALLHDLCGGISEPEQGMGRKRLPLKDIIFASVFKVYSTFSGRRFTVDLEEAHAKGYISKLPHYNSVFRYLEKPELYSILQDLVIQSSLPLQAVETDFAVDASGFSMSKKINWCEERYHLKSSDTHDWVKVHLMVGVKTNIVTAVEIFERMTHDSVVLPYLLNTTARNFQMQTVTGDKAYSSKVNLDLIASKGAVPFVAFRKNSICNRQGRIWDQMFHFYNLHREEFMHYYHLRSNIESTFSAIKCKFGGYVRSKTPTAQVNEVLAKVLCHNICVLIQSMRELGIGRNWQE